MQQNKHSFLITLILFSFTMGVIPLDSWILLLIYISTSESRPRWLLLPFALVYPFLWVENGNKIPNPCQNVAMLHCLHDCNAVQITSHGSISIYAIGYHYLKKKSLDRFIYLILQNFRLLKTVNNQCGWNCLFCNPSTLCLPLVVLLIIYKTIERW